MRNFNIVVQNQPITKNNTFTNIEITDIDQIINHSADTIYCSSLENIEISKINDIIQNILNKIKPGGQVIFDIMDVKKYCSEVVSGKLSSHNLLNLLKTHNSCLTPEDIYTKLDVSNLQIAQVLKNNSRIEIVIQRINI